MSITCDHESCDCQPAPDDLRQLKCANCGTFSDPMRWDGLPTDHPPTGGLPAKGCWVTTGLLCPACSHLAESPA